MTNINPNDNRNLYENAKQVLESGNFEEAEQQFLQYLKLNQHQFTPDEGLEFFMQMIRIYIALHQYPKAKECITYGLTISPDKPELQSLLKQVITHETMKKAVSSLRSDALTSESLTPTDTVSKKKMEYIKKLEEYGLTREEIDYKVKEAIKKMKGWIDEKTALFVVSKELGIELDTKTDLSGIELNEG